MQLAYQMDLLNVPSLLWNGLVVSYKCFHPDSRLRMLFWHIFFIFHNQEASQFKNIPMVMNMTIDEKVSS